ncbi:glutamate--cysteine ligase [Pyxidicoccus parkwayensis]|uniref:Glutamate--cysteine ligase n=1 Tax=Pyxidicoccus parkwayensis TaxID=2813578 RepID=A0ABX7NRC4_9BACT|nr:glutamate--cysteine ligase [Pyxidicoccus parkwaysis]QSQ19951.1 glutamate--cysteine ligase [Pyxidicoccus parkwaysis]
MGLAIQQEEFRPEDYERFSRRLTENLEALRVLLARPGFGEGPSTVGAELELFLVDAAGFPLPINRQVLAQTMDPRVTLELDRFNLEVNLRPGPLAGRPFTALREEFEDTLREVRRAAATQGARVAVIGILPTLREADLGRGAMTGQARYRALSAAIRRRRAGPIHVSIHGEDALALTWDDVTLEGANTSLQYHLRVAPPDFARMYNAAQLATAPVLAVSGNSPLFLGRRLWDETRVALFRQSVDDRGEPGEGGFHPHARVSFGHGWAREGAHELFAEAVALHPPLLPVCGRESPLERVKAGGLPGLDELRLHQSTVWTWNRAIYDPKCDGHLRIELRALPAGPTVVDMVANGAFLYGLTLALAERVDALLPAMPFVHAYGNFIRASRTGLDAELLWPSDTAPSPRPVPALELVPRLLPLAREGLVKAGVEADEADAMLAIIERRVALGRTGARWQRRVLARLAERMPREDALAAMLERYLLHADAGEPLHTWPVE